MPTQNYEPLPLRPQVTVIQGVLWDMDGTLLDTEPHWMAAEANLVAEFGGCWSHEQGLELVGKALPDSAAGLQAAGVQLSTREIINRLIDEVAAGVAEHVSWRPGALELLAELHAAGVPCGLVTMSEEPLAKLVLDQLPEKYFNFRVTGDMVAQGKPHPEPYLLGLKMLADYVPDLEATRVIGLEDSAPGISSAAASGITAVLVPHLSEVPSSNAWHRVDSLSSLNLPTLEALLTVTSRA